MCGRKPVECSGVADPISAKCDQPHITRAEACLGHICVAVVVSWGRDGSKPLLSGYLSIGHFDKLSDRRLCDRHIVRLVRFDRLSDRRTQRAMGYSFAMAVVSWSPRPMV